MAIAFQNLLFRISFFISWEILCPCMQQLFMCMDAWELAGKGDGHILWVRISSKPDTGEATSARKALSVLLNATVCSQT